METEALALALAMPAALAAVILNPPGNEPPPYREPVELEAARIVSDWSH